MCGPSYDLHLLYRNPNNKNNYVKKITDFRGLFKEQFKELLNVEKQQCEILPKFINKIESYELKRLVQKSINETEQQLKRLGDMLNAFGESRKPAESKVMKELLERGLDLANVCNKADVIDAGLIFSLQCVKHFEIAEYETLVSFAFRLEENEIMQVLNKTIAEEKRLDEELTELAERSFNRRVKKPTFIIA